ncbi:aspartate kinase [Chamaesiphon sp. VAR_48_metabat_135_sub]|uniref:aspartate kinase n=1 Tax=Chamaesiphon sp. VAR_48_metabat_135_sub TaxID=2964699 RepID=UPI00286B2EDC|nr:aspartate kinase [Chamaesiphon sp. VAR_48_metabat_135_sub]
MALIVQKYGGTSVGSAERIQAVAKRVVETVKAGNDLVVVVSAMGKTTDGLVKLAKELSSQPSRREMDMLLATGEQVTIALLSIAIQELGQPAISLTGAQVGIVTEAEHSRARILEIAPDRIERHLKEGKVVVVAGFQGVSATGDRDITTLGRGGSDTSAVALAAALKASACEIYTDVPGILTTDPRIVPEAQLLTEITADEMLELASLGAKVLHPRAVEIARNYGVPLVVRSSWTDDPGTWVISPAPQPRSLNGLEIARPVDAVEFATNQAKIAILQVPDRAGIAGQLFGTVATENVDVDLIVQSIHEGNTNDIAFTVNKQMTKRAQAVAEAISPVLHDNSTLSDTQVLVADDIAKVSIVGAGMIGRPGVAAQMFKTLADAGVNIQMISTSEIKVSCVIPASDGDRAIAALCQQFEISSSSTTESDTARITAPAVRGVALDLDRARLAIRQVPDRPGMAAELFGILAVQNISVDTIIQSQRTRIVAGVAMRDIACTIAQGDAADAKRVLEASAAQLGCGEVVVDDSVAKVSIVGAGMIDKPGVAAQMFNALAAAGINIQMIATSEIKISCVVARAQGIDALKTVHRAFGLG